MSVQDILNGTLGRDAATGGMADLTAIAGELLPRSGESFAESLGAMTNSLDALGVLAHAQVEAIGSNTDAVLQNTVAQSSGGAKQTLSTIGKFASGILGTGFGLMPAVSAISKLFGGGDEESPPPLRTYSAPPALHIDATYQAGTAVNGTWAGIAARSTGQRNNEADAATRMASPSAGEDRGAPQITIQVQAMDSRSFMDHSGEIARAVREAMLNMHSLNDVVTEL